MPTYRLTAGATALALLGLAAGCGGGSTKVTGSVTYQGKPVVWGSVTLMDERGQYHQGPIGLDGTYSIDGVPAGRVKIGVFSPKPDDPPPAEAAKTGPKKMGTPGPEDPRAKFKQTPNNVPRPSPGQWFPIPERYGDPTSSDLSGEVRSGQPLDINIP